MNMHTNIHMKHNNKEIHTLSTSNDKNNPFRNSTASVVSSTLYKTRMNFIILVEKKKKR